MILAFVANAALAGTLPAAIDLALKGKDVVVKPTTRSEALDAWCEDARYCVRRAWQANGSGTAFLMLGNEILAEVPVAGGDVHLEIGLRDWRAGSMTGTAFQIRSQGAEVTTVIGTNYDLSNQKMCELEGGEILGQWSWPDGKGICGGNQPVLSLHLY